MAWPNFWTFKRLKTVAIFRWCYWPKMNLLVALLRQITLCWNRNEWRKTEQVPIPLPSAASTLNDEGKTFKKKFCLWTSEIIQFIRFENHMDRPRNLKIFLGYLIIYLSIWYFMSHGCFTARNMLEFGLITLIIHSVLSYLILHCFK